MPKAKSVNKYRTKELYQFKKRYIIILSVIIVLLFWYGATIYELLKPKLIQNHIIAPISITSQNYKDQFIYPTLGIRAPITFSSQTNPMDTRDWNKIGTSLKNGVSANYSEKIFEDSSLVFIIGHSSDNYPHKYSSIFAPLGQAKKGDDFYVATDLKIYHYTVTDSKILNPNDLDGFNSLKSDSIKQVALITCWPVLSIKNRLVILGQLQTN